MIREFLILADGEATISKLNEVIFNPLIKLMFAVALLLFMYGLVEFMLNRGDTEAVEKGKIHMIWGVIGFAVMVSVFGIINFLVKFIDGLPK